MAGWIKLHRKIVDNPVWDDKPFSKGQAWIDLILMANHNPTKLIYGNTIIELDRGQLHTSESNLMKRWGWSKKKVRAYFLLLKRLEMATAKGTMKGTTVTIENYALYQSMGTEQDTDEDTAKEPLRNREGTAKGKQTRSKEGEECKEPKEEKKDIYSDLPIELHEPLKKYIEMRKGMGKTKTMTDHAIKLFIGKLTKLSKGDVQLQVEMLEEATMKNWMSVYLPKEDKPKGEEKIRW